MARRGTRADQYHNIAAFFGVELVRSLSDPRIPDFVLVGEARRAAHYGLRALAFEEKRRRKGLRAVLPGTVRLESSFCAVEPATEGSIPS